VVRVVRSARGAGAERMARWARGERYLQSHHLQTKTITKHNTIYIMYNIIYTGDVTYRHL